jgi:hypothetical protein
MFDIVEAVKDFGANTITIIMPMSRLEYIGIIPGFAFRSSGSSQELVDCSINEDRYTVKDEYKITITANNVLYGKEDFYISDFNSMINSVDSQITIIATQHIGNDFEVITLHSLPEINNTPPTFLEIFKGIFGIS